MQYLECIQMQPKFLNFIKWAGTQISIFKLNMVNVSFKLYVIYVYAVMYFC